jgi:hypothetical protein
VWQLSPSNTATSPPRSPHPQHTQTKKKKARAEFRSCDKTTKSGTGRYALTCVGGERRSEDFATHLTRPLATLLRGARVRAGSAWRIRRLHFEGTDHPLRPSSRERRWCSWCHLPHCTAHSFARCINHSAYTRHRSSPCNPWRTAHRRKGRQDRR